MTRECAIELLRYAKAAEKIQFGWTEERSAYTSLAMNMALAAGMTWDEIQAFRGAPLPSGTALLIVEKYEKLFDKALEEHKRKTGKI